jgi:hypothetical protein
MKNSPPVSAKLFQVFEIAASITFYQMAKSINLDTLDEFVNLCSTFLCYQTSMFLQSNLIFYIIDLSLDLCTFNEKQNNKTALRFIKNLISANGNAMIKTCVTNAQTLYAEVIIKTLIESTAFVFEKELLALVVDIFSALKSSSPQGFSDLLFCALKHMPKKNFSGIVATTDDGITNFYNAINRYMILF